MESDTLYDCLTKATTVEGNDIRHSMNWVAARRAKLRVSRTRLECGGWRIHYSEISEAVLFSTRQMFISCYVPRVGTSSWAYQFGLNPNAFWKGEPPFPVRRERMKLRYSAFSLLIRAVLIAAVQYLARVMSR